MLKRWQDLSPFMQVPEVGPYWRVLNARRGQLLAKRLFDFSTALILLLLLDLPMRVLALLDKTTSKGPVFYRQQRVTINGKCFRIHKFRTMVANATRAPDAVYTGTILPSKMRWNLNSLSRFSFFGEIATMFRTLLAVLGKNYA